MAPLSAIWWPACRIPRSRTSTVRATWSITGIGGTGVVTVGAVLGMAAHIEGKGVSVLDQVGLSQKGGAVVSEVRLAARPEEIHSVTVGRGRTDLLLGCDMVVAADAEVRGCLSPKVSAAVVNAHRAPVAQFVLDPDLSFGTRRMMELIAESSREEATDFVDATRLATTLFGRQHRGQPDASRLCRPAGGTCRLASKRSNAPSS